MKNLLLLSKCASASSSCLHQRRAACRAHCPRLPEPRWIPLRNPNIHGRQQLCVRSHSGCAAVSARLSDPAYGKGDRLCHYVAANIQHSQNKMQQHKPSIMQYSIYNRQHSIYSIQSTTYNELVAVAVGKAGRGRAGRALLVVRLSWNRFRSAMLSSCSLATAVDGTAAVRRSCTAAECCARTAPHSAVHRETSRSALLVHARGRAQVPLGSGL